MTRSNALYLRAAAVDGIAYYLPHEEGFRVWSTDGSSLEVVDPDTNEHFLVEVRVFEVTGQ